MNASNSPGDIFIGSPPSLARRSFISGEAMHMSPEQFDAFLRKENAVLGKVMRDAGVKPQ